MSDYIRLINAAAVPAAKTSSPETPQPAMAFEDWRDVTSGNLTPSQVINREYDARPIDGLDPIEEARKGAAGKPPFVYIGKGHALGNPNRPSRASEHEAALSLWHHYRRTLSARDGQAAALMTALARTGRDMAEQAGEREASRPQRSHAEDAQTLRDTGADGESASDVAEEIGSMRQRMAANRSSRFTVVANTEAEAKVVRGMIDWARTQMKAPSQFEEAVTLFSPKTMPSAGAIDAGLEHARPALVQAREQGGEPRKLVAVIAGRGAEDAAVEMTKQLDRDINVVPGKNGTLWKKLIAENTHTRTAVGFTRGDYSPQSIKEDNLKAVQTADQVVVSWNGDERDFALTAAAEAARRGKLAAVTDAAGNQLDIDEVAKTAMAANPTAREQALKRHASAFDVPASSPEGRLGLSKVRGMPKHGVDILSLTTFTLNEISEMAKDEAGRASLYRDHRVPGSAIAAMADENAVADAQASLERITGHCKETGVEIVGPENFPRSLQASGKVHTVLFLKSGNPEGFRDLEKSVGILGDQELLAPVARDATKISQAIDAAGIPSVRVEGQGAPASIPQTKDSVLVLPSGHGHANVAAKMNWQQDGDTRWTAEGPSGRTWTVAQNASGRYDLTHDGADKVLATYDPAQELKVGRMSAEERKQWDGAKDYTVLRQKRAQKGKQPGYAPLETVSADGLGDAIKNHPDVSHVMANPAGVMREVGDVREERRRAALGPAHFEAEARTRLMRKAEQSEANRMVQQVMEQRDAFVAAGGHVVSHLPPVETGSVYVPEAGRREGFDSHATDVTRSEAAMMVSNMSNALVVTQCRARSPHLRHAIAEAARTKTPMAVKDPERHYDTLPEVAGNMALMGKGRDIPSKIGLSGTHARPFEQELANKRVAGRIESGKEAEFIDRLQTRLEGKAPTAKKAERNGAEAEV